MQLNVCTANKLSALCKRVQKVEKQLGITNACCYNPMGLGNPFGKMNTMCQRIKRLEKAVGIKTVKPDPKHPYKPLGPSGNAVLSNKVNTLCGRLARVEKVSATFTPLIVI